MIDPIIRKALDAFDERETQIVYNERDRPGGPTWLVGAIAIVATVGPPLLLLAALVLG